MNVIIDKYAGVCPGVWRAIKLTEKRLRQGQLDALGPLIHNSRELDRLRRLGLSVLSQDDIEKSNGLSELRNRRVLIRTHGISSRLENSLRESGADLTNATCRIVKNLQRLVQERHEEGYQILIIGKHGHPEIKGLAGHCENKAIVIEDEQDLATIDRTGKSVLIAQTTVSRRTFWEFSQLVKSLVPDLIIQDTTCGHINERHQKVREFAGTVDVVLFVGGRNSSNTGILHGICRDANPRSYRIESQDDVRLEWFLQKDIIGITGGASTPLWQLQEIKDFIEKNTQLG